MEKKISDNKKGEILQFINENGVRIDFTGEVDYELESVFDVDFEPSTKKIFIYKPAEGSKYQHYLVEFSPSGQNGGDQKLNWFWVTDKKSDIQKIYDIVNQRENNNVFNVTFKNKDTLGFVLASAKSKGCSPEKIIEDIVEKYSDQWF